MYKKIIIILLIASMALGFAVPGNTTGTDTVGTGAYGAGGGAPPPPAIAGAGYPGAFVEGEVLAAADSMEHALEIASAYGLELKSYAYGIAVLEAPNPEITAARSHLMRRSGIPELSLNIIYSLIVDKTALDYSGATPGATAFAAHDMLSNPWQETVAAKKSGARPFSGVGASPHVALSSSSEEWHHELLDTKRAWDVTKGAGIIVAVIDTGIDVYHPAFTGRIMANSYNSYSNQVGLQYVQDNYGHGTHVSGIVAASSPSASGIAPEAIILAIKANIPENPGYLEMASTLRGINYAVANGARVINLSYGSPFAGGPNQLERDTIASAVANGATVVCSAGNDRHGNANYPAAYPETIAVSALWEGGLFDSSYSNYGQEIELSAPGTHVFSTEPGGVYEVRSGTSMAAPNVSGVAALVIARNPDYSPAQVRAALRDTARQKGALGHDAYYGYGIVNAYSAVLGAGSLHGVSYDFNDGARAPVTVRAIDGGSLFEPDEPRRDTYVFDGWHTSAVGGSKFDFVSPITENMTLYAQWTVMAPGMYAAIFPDPSFRKEVLRILNSFDGGDRTPSSTVTGEDFEAIAEEWSLYLPSMNIGSIAGIEHFTGLKYLYCAYNNLEELDVSNSPGLRELFCSYNNLSKLDVSGNPLLEEIWADFNLLTELDLSICDKLQIISLMENQLTKLDVSNCDKLRIFTVFDNLLTELDVTGNLELETIWVDGNMLTKLDVSRNVALRNLSCGSNMLTKLDVSENTRLYSLSVRNNLLTELDVSKNKELEGLLCDWNEIAELDVSNNPALNMLWAFRNRLTKLDVSNAPLDVLICFNNLLETIDLTNNPELTYLECYENFMGNDPDKSVAGWRALFTSAGTKDDGSDFQYFPQNVKEPPPVPTPTPTPTPPWPSPTTPPPPPPIPGTPPAATTPTPAPPVIQPQAPTPVPSRPNPFSDVNEGDWFYSAVRFVYLNDLFGGTSATTFSPGQPMTRAMFATVLWRLEKTPNPGNSQSAPQSPRFSDVAESAWFYGGVSWAAQSGVVSGVGGGRFDPGAPVTREQMAVMLMNYFRFKGISLDAGPDAAAFSDEAKISGWAKASVLAIQRARIIGGKPGNLFDPQGSATRAEVAAIFSRIDSVIK